MQLVSTPDAPKPVAAYSQAVVSNGVVYCSGQVGLDPQSNALADGLAAQAEQVFKNIGAVLHAAGTHPGNVVKVNIFLGDL
ncbi:MAG TPA: Rid family hydrolase, partial [Candidatus Eremiobacteraceae bacterium]|nr:Rid family hydrolase [Candidatus Eremiobacteraceae bacterium]